MSFDHFLRITFSSKERQPHFFGKKHVFLRTCRGNEANPDIGMEKKGSHLDRQEKKKRPKKEPLLGCPAGSDCK